MFAGVRRIERAKALFENGLEALNVASQLEQLLQLLVAFQVSNLLSKHSVIQIDI